MKDVEKMVDSNGVVMQIVDGAARDMIAEEYDATASYAVGEHCIYNNNYYVCNTAISGGEAWDATHWDAATVGAENTALKSSLSDLENVIGQIDGVTIYKQILNQDIVSFSAESSMPIMKLVSNISNVSGCTEANIVVTGKNIFGGLPLANAIVNAGGTLDTVNKTVSFTHGKSQVNILDKVKLKESTKYTFILTYSNTGDNNCLSLFYKTSGTRYPINLNNSSDTKTTIVYTTSAITIDKLVLGWIVDASTKIYYEESGLFEGELTAADFENYNGNLYNIPFVDGGGNTLTVYNGSINLINGVLIDNDNSTTYQLPATPINDLQGENNIWSDTGSIANVGYLDILNIS